MSPAITANNIATMIATHNLLSTKRQELLLLSNQKQSLETEAEAIISELTSQQPDSNVPPIGIDTPLVDSEGYPRSDIDIYRARHLRKRLHEIRNDHKELERRIGNGLLELNVLQQQQQGGDANTSSSSNKVNNNNGKDNEAEEIKARRAPKPKPKYDAATGKWVVKSWDGSVAGIENGETRSFDDLAHNSEGALASIATTATSTTGGGGSGERNSQGSTTITPQQTMSTTTTTRRTPQQQQQTLALTPFAIIDEVFSNSPSKEAGIQTGDLLLRFGSVTADNHNGFDAIKRAIVTQLSLAAANGDSISIAVRRSTVELGGVAEMIRTENIDLKPRQWAGKGLLGCHLQEYKE